MKTPYSGRQDSTQHGLDTSFPSCLLWSASHARHPPCAVWPDRLEFSSQSSPCPSSNPSCSVAALTSAQTLSICASSLNWGCHRTSFLEVWWGLSELMFKWTLMHMLVANLLSHVQLFVTPWTVLNSPGRNTGVGCHSLLQGIFPTQGSNTGLLLCRQILYHLSHQGNQCREGARYWVGLLLFD